MKLSEIQIKYKSNIKKRIKVSTSNQAYEVFRELWDESTIELREEMKVVLLNRDNVVLGAYTLSTGGVASTIADKRLIFGVALKANASGIVIAHNHPSGNLGPSATDKDLTSEIKSVGKLMDIQLLDHLILTRDDYFSFADNGLI